VSPPLWKQIEVEDDKLRLKGNGSIIFCSADTNQLNRITDHREINIAGNLFDLFRFELVEEPFFGSTMTWRVPLHGGKQLLYLPMLCFSIWATGRRERTPICRQPKMAAAIGVLALENSQPPRLPRMVAAERN
jgi:hypothetical protein